MPWNECKPMDERLRFVARLLVGEKMAPLCREFGISRVTGCKIFDRYKACGLDGLHDRSKAPYRQANQLPFQVESSIVQLKQEPPRWGAPKIREKLRRMNLGVNTPAISTVHAVLDPMAWSPAGVVTALGRTARRSPRPCSPMTSGAPTRASPSSSSNALSRTSGYPARSAPTTACPSPARARCSA